MFFFIVLAPAFTTELAGSPHQLSSKTLGALRLNGRGSKRMFNIYTVYYTRREGGLQKMATSDNEFILLAATYFVTFHYQCVSSINMKQLQKCVY